MYTKTKSLSPLVLALVLFSTFLAAGKKTLPEGVETTERQPAILWREPIDIQSRDLFYGPGGKKHLPHGILTFVKEDLEGSNPKFVVQDQDGMKWKAKLGPEARPEVVATRLLWSVGYFANEDYLVKLLRPAKMRALQRGQQFIDPDGTMRNVRVKREPPNEKKIGTWAWSEDPFTDTRELNGLRVMMALINDWDLKDENNAVYRHASPAGEGSERIFMVSDVGVSFGTARPSWPKAKARGNLRSYAHSRFIEHVNPNSVDFLTPGRPPLIFFFIKPNEYRYRRGLAWIGWNVPRDDARWIGQILAKLSHEQIRDAFRAASYTPEEVEQFASVLEGRIAELNTL